MEPSIVRKYPYLIILGGLCVLALNGCHNLHYDTGVYGNLRQESGCCYVEPWPEGEVARVTATSLDAKGHKYSVTSNSNGTFSLDAPPGHYTITAIMTMQKGLATPQEIVIPDTGHLAIELLFISP
jgi:hypothetical protein